MVARSGSAAWSDEGRTSVRIVQPTEAALSEAADAIRAGRLVGMPTETVYGLAADATNVQAVRAVFLAKGRPSQNPLIVHLAGIEEVDGVALEFPQPARALAEEHWPGPLTLVLRKRPSVPDEVTAGLPSVAVRVPAHPVARRLIEAAGCPLAAPSANSFMHLSPTRAEDIEPCIAERLALILDGGPCEVGIESTVVDCTGPELLVLRRGMLRIDAAHAATSEEFAHISPGQYPRHYAPTTPLLLVAKLQPHQPGLTLGPTQSEFQRQLSGEPRRYAAELYAALHDLDRANLETIYVETPPETEEWAAVRDRLMRAAHPG